MSIDMYLESARSQANSLSSISAQCVQQNIELIKVLENFVAEEELKGHAYDSAKAHITSTVIPLIQGIVLYQESLAEECQKFVSQYTSDVDSKSWRQVDLEEKIREADQKISNIQQLMETKSDNKISAFLNLSVSIAVLEGAKQKLQKILISLLTFNAVSPTIFLNSERYLLAVQNGFAQAAQSWDATSGTYLPPSNGADLSWKQTISLGWQKRQAVLNKVKNPKVETLEEKLSKMSRAELEEEYGSVIQSYKRFLTMGQGDNVTATMDYEDVKLIWKRYNEVKNDHLGLLPSELAKVDPKFKKRIDAMDQEAIEEAYPELKTLISMAHVNPYAQLFKSETERANYDYLLDRYFLLDSQKMLSWRDPAFQTKYDYYIIEEGIDPFTGKPATQEEINRAKDIKKVRTVTESFQLASTLYTSYVGYNQYYNKPYTTFSDVFSKVKGKVPFFNRKPVIPEVNPKVDTNVKTITEPAKTYDRERILRNIEESKLARESSNFDQYLAKEKFQKTLIDMEPVDRQRYLQWHNYAEAGIDPSDRAKLRNWAYPPDPEFYLKNKNVYDNPDYFNQLTGNTIYPGTPESALGRVDGSIHKDGFLDGKYKESVILPGTRINRIGSNPTGRYFSPEGATFGEKALPPFMKLQPNSDYIVLKEIPTKVGLVAPWFDEPGMGIQYFTYSTIDELEKGRFLLRLK
ncbi:TNT domain-containing protein [Streptococcus parasanguinis]|uniref:TNT domain-containing protein n=1 Tax=Streptococcus parasanguinis TaxID=1318 RepID=UPI00352EDE6E